MAYQHFFSEADKHNVTPRFYMRDKTTKDGKVVQKPYVEITIPGTASSVHDTPVHDTHKRRWPEQWKAFEEGIEATVNGTPLEKSGLFSVQQMAHFQSLNIYTVEQLASVHDGNLTHLGMGGQGIRDRAREYLASNVGPSAEEQMRAELEVMRAELAELKAKRGPGRPKKNADDSASVAA